MKNWTIKAINGGYMRGSKLSVAGGNVDANIMLDIPFTCLLLQNGEENILVDSGVKDSYVDVMNSVGIPSEGGTQWLLNGLAEYGLTPKDITSVIYTHLHYDHSGNGELFLDKPTYVQRAEVENMLSPYDFQRYRGEYFPDTKEWFPKVKNVVYINGSVTLPNGLELYLTKGHSLGSQSIVVPTAKGRYVITGDVPDVLCSLFPWMDEMTLADGSRIKITPVDVRFTTSSYINDIFSAYDSHYLQMTLAERPEPEFFICAHEPSVLYRKFWG